MSLVDFDTDQKVEIAKQLRLMGLGALTDETLAALLGEHTPNELIHLLNSFYQIGYQLGLQNGHLQAQESINKAIQDFKERAK